MALWSRLPRARAVPVPEGLTTLAGERVLATAFRLLDQAAPRVGSERYLAKHGSRGLTTLRRRDAAVEETVTITSIWSAVTPAAASARPAASRNSAVAPAR